MSNSFSLLFQRLLEKIQAGGDKPFLKRLVIVPDKYSKAAIPIKLAQELPQKVIFGTTFLLPHETKSVTFQDCLSRSARAGHAEKQAESLFLSSLYGLADKERAGIHLEMASDQLANYEEIHLFNFSALAPSFHQRLISLSAHLPVTYYINSPCMLFWSDIASDREARRLERVANLNLQEALRPLLYNRSRLLANNASLAREFTELLETSVEAVCEKYLVSDWVMNDPCYSQYIRPETEINAAAALPALLEVVQAELLLLGPKREEKIVLSKEDKSVQLHKAPTLFREVEILYQNIQEFVGSKAALAPGSIVVLAPSIEQYRPYIDSLFTHSCQVLGEKGQEIYSCFLSMLELPVDSFQPFTLFELFKTLSFRKKAGLESEDLTALAACLQRLGFAADFESCVEQVIASWITSRNVGFDFPNSDAESIASALFAIRKLIRDVKNLLSENERAVSEWVELFRGLLEDYFASEAELETILAALTYLAKSAKSNRLEKANIRLMKLLFCEAVEAMRSSHPSSIYSPIIFATLGEYLPHSVEMVCLLGMNEEAFPRNSKHLICMHGFLFSDKLPLKAAAIDRHLLLYSLLAAKKRLFLSCQSYSYEDRLEMPVASFVQDLLQTLDETCSIEGDLPTLRLVHNHAQDSLIREVRCEASQTFVKRTKASPERLYVHELSQVAKYPLRPYFQHNLGLYLHDFETGLAKSEFEAHDAMAFSALRKEALFAESEEARQLVEKRLQPLPPLLKGAMQACLDGEKALLKSNADAMGVRLHEVMQVELTSSCKKPIKLAANSWKVPALSFDISGLSFTLEGRLVNLHPQGFLVLGAKSKEALYRAFPELLVAAVLAALYPTEVAFQSRCLFLKDAKEQVAEIGDPVKKLTQYIEYALECRDEPFCLYPDWIEKLKTSSHFLSSLKQNFLARDPYLDHYLSKVTDESLLQNWPKWRLKALSLFGGVEDGI